MENQAGFDLERSMTEWLQELGNQPSCTRADRQELEDHLRESVARFQSKGLLAEEAFLLARRRLGDARALDAEFSKVNHRRVWLDRALWMLVGIQAWALLWDVGELARMAAGFGFAWVEILPARGWAGPGGWYRSLGPAALLAGVELALLAGCAVALARWTSGRQAALSVRVDRALGRSSSSALLALVLLVAGFSVKFAMLIGATTGNHVMPVPQYAALLMSTGLASTVITFAQVLSVPILLVVFARRRASAAS